VAHTAQLRSGEGRGPLYVLNVLLSTSNNQTDIVDERGYRRIFGIEYIMGCTNETDETN
jgi:hypothetical protein